MDKQGGGMIAKVRGFFMAIWAVVTVPLYAIVCTFTGPFSRALTQSIGKHWMILFLRIAGVKISVRGAENLDKKECYIFFANHSSLLDIPVLYAAVGNQLVFIAKKELFWIPFMGWGMKGMGHVSIDRGSARKALGSFKNAILRMKKEHLSTVLFPEGTRSVDGRLGEFKQGSFTLALDAGIKVVPVAIRNSGVCLPKKSLLVRPGEVMVDIGEPFSPDGMKKADLMELIREKIAAVVEK